MKEYLKIALFLGAILCLQSCRKQLETRDYIDWMKDKSNGYSVESLQKFGKIEVEQRTAKYMALVSLRGEVLTEEVVSERTKEYQGSYYFNLKISEDAPAQKNTRQYYQSIEYLTSYIQKDLFIVQGSDTIPCSLHHYERTYGISPSQNILLVFDKKDEKEDFNGKLIFNDQFFSMETISIDFKDPKTEPKLKL